MTDPTAYSMQPPLGGDPLPSPVQQRPGWRHYLKMAWAPLLFILLKLKTILLLISKGKILGPLISSIVSIAAYSLFFGWPFAVLFVAQLFVHEMGHALELRRQGIKASAPMFIPFLGAVIAMKEMPHDARKEAQMAIAGPIFGGLAALVILLLGIQMDSDLLMAAAYTGFWLNLFNLIPLTPLDGGRIVAALHPAMWAIGALMVAAAFFILHSPILLLIGVIGGLDAWHRWRTRKEPGHAEYYTVTPRTRLIIGLSYAALAVALIYGMNVSFVDHNTLG